MLHSIGTPEIDCWDSVLKQNQISVRFTVCLANPPFKRTVDAESINDNLKAVTSTKKTAYKHPPTSEILTNIESLEAEIQKELQALKEMLK